MLATLLASAAAVSLASAKTPAEITTLGEYNAQLNASCSEDSDCAKVNVGNCCGFYPMCMNAKNSGANPDLVNQLCREEGSFGICGFPSIDQCQCTQGTCEPCGLNKA